MKGGDTSHLQWKFQKYYKERLEIAILLEERSRRDLNRTLLLGAKIKKCFTLMEMGTPKVRCCSKCYV